jgi:hypothetical protein
MSWINLLDSNMDYLPRGILLKFTVQDPFEDEVVMMVCEGYANAFRKGLMRITGFKAGINAYVFFPEEVTTNGLSRQWLIDNWTKWVCPEGDVGKVLIREYLNAKELSS